MLKRIRTEIPAHCGAIGLGLVGLMGLLGCRATTAVAQIRTAGEPDLTIGAAQFPEDDAIILRWEQHWTLDADGTVHRRDHRWIKLLNNRPIRRYGDPRIAHVKDGEKLIIHQAQSILPDGTVLPVPDYSFNEAANDAVSGWPEYSDWQDMIVSFSGIQPGVVLELDYEIVTPSGVISWIEGDLRLNETDPTVERVVTVTVPTRTPLHFRFDRADAMKASLKESTDGGSKTYRWSGGSLAGDRDEPGSLPWSLRSGRLRFSTCPSTAHWVAALTDRVERSAVVTDAITSVAEKAIEHETDPAEKARKLAEKIRESFNFVNDANALRGLACRSAADVCRTNYGNMLESAAFLLAAVRALGLEAAVLIGVDADRWGDGDSVSPGLAGFAGAVVRVESSEGALLFHPQHGEIKNPGSWGRHYLLSARDGELKSDYVYARGERGGSDLRMTGKIAVDKDAKATGELRIHATGKFFDPADLDSADAQKEWVEDIVGRVVSDFEVTSHSVVMLSEELLKVTAQVATEDSIKKPAGHYTIRFGDGLALQKTFHLPLDRSYRRTHVRTGGDVRETVNLTIELPKDWKASIVPTSLKAVEGSWGRAEQSATFDDHTLRFRRSVSIEGDVLSPDAFNSLREALNELRTNKSVMFGFQTGQ